MLSLSLLVGQRGGRRSRCRRPPLPTAYLIWVCYWISPKKVSIADTSESAVAFAVEDDRRRGRRGGPGYWRRRRGGTSELLLTACCCISALVRSSWMVLIGLLLEERHAKQVKRREVLAVIVIVRINPLAVAEKEKAR